MRKCGTPTARPSSATSVSAAANGTAFSNGNAFGGSDGSVHGGSQNGSMHGGSQNGSAGVNGNAGSNAGGGNGAVGGGIGGGEKTSHSLWLYTRKFVRLLLTKPVRYASQRLSLGPHTLCRVKLESVDCLADVVLCACPAARAHFSGGGSAPADGRRP